MGIIGQSQATLPEGRPETGEPIRSGTIPESNSRERTSALVGGAAIAAADTFPAARAIPARLLSTFFPTPFVRFPFVLKRAAPVTNHRIRRILSAIVTVIAEHAVRCFNFRAGRFRARQSAAGAHAACDSRTTCRRSAAQMDASDRRRARCVASARLTTVRCSGDIGDAARFERRRERTRRRAEFGRP